MADTASLVVRVKSEGVEESAQALDKLTESSERAARQNDEAARHHKQFGDEVKKESKVVNDYTGVIESLGNKLAVLQEANESGARSAAQLAASLKLGDDASDNARQSAADLAGAIYDEAQAQKQAADAAVKAAQQEKQATAEKARAAQVVQQLENQLLLLKTAQTGGATAANTLNSQLKAGAGASEEQKAKIASLTSEIDKMSAASNSAIKVNGRTRNSIQQIGYQMQDFVVQVQGGTSAFVALSQQGSQLAGVFGASGAVFGAVLALASAIGGTLYAAMDKAKVSTKDLSAAQENLAAVLKRSENGAYNASDAFANLIRTGASAALIQSRVQSAQQAITTELKANAQASKEAAEAGDTLWNGNAVGAAASMKAGSAASSLSGYIDDLSKKFGITRSEAEKLTPLLADVQKNANPKSTQALAKATSDLSEKYKGGNADLVKLNGAMQDSVRVSQEAEKERLALSTIVEDTNKKNKKSDEQYLLSLEAQSVRGRKRIEIEKKIKVQEIKDRQDLDQKAKDKALAFVDDWERNEIKILDDRENTKTKKASDAESKRQQARQKAADNYLNLIDRTSGLSIDKIDATEKQRLEKIQENLKNGLYTQQQYEDAKTQIINNAEMQRSALKVDAESKQNSADSFVAQMQSEFEGESGELDRQYAIKLQKLQAYHDAVNKLTGKRLISDEVYQKQSAQLQQKYDQAKLDSQLTISAQIAGNISSAAAEGTAIQKAAAITQATINTYLGATKALAEGGPFLGPILASSIITLGLANVAKITSAREQGGSLGRGQVSTIAERGKPEIIMPAGASRVRTADQMRQIMGENGGSRGGSDSVTIVNNTSAQIGTATTERDDEGRLRIIISEQVANELQDSNSGISKARRTTRGQPGF